MARSLHNAEPPRALLLACGNTFRGDDGVGWRIGCAIEQQPPRAGLTVVMTRQLLPEHAEAVSSADLVVFVDCSVIGAAGTVSIIPIEPTANLPSALTHYLDPAALLRLARDLYARTPARVVLVTIGGASFDWTDQLSNPVKSAIPQALAAVRRMLLDGLSLQEVIQTQQSASAAPGRALAKARQPTPKPRRAGTCRFKE